MQKTPMQKLNHKNGFTLIEILVVISIIGILTALLLANFVGIRERANDAKLKNDATQLKSALRLYYNDYQVYPDAAGTSILGCGSDGTTACSVGGSFAAGTMTYMKELPPLSYYARTNSGDGFALCVTLQNAGDEDIEQTQRTCFSDTKSSPAGVDPTDYCTCND